MLIRLEFLKPIQTKEKEKKSADKHYKCMNKKDIQELPISSIAEENSILCLMGKTFPCLEEGLGTY